MVTTDGPGLVLQQLETSHQRKRDIHPELRSRLALQDQRLYDLLLRQRAGEPVEDAIAAELLPVARAKADRMSPIRLYGRDDLRQELAIELVKSARRITLRRSSFLTRRLMLDAAKALTRRLEKEWLRQLEEWYHLANPIPHERPGGEPEEDYR